MNKAIEFNGFSNFGGYGFWCNAKCAERRDAKLQVKESAKTTDAETASKQADALLKLAGITDSSSSGSSLPLYLGIGAGVLVLGTIIFIALR